MCIPIPTQVISVEAGRARVAGASGEMSVGCQALPDVRPGDWVLIYLGQAVERVSPDEAAALEELLREVNWAAETPTGAAQAVEERASPSG